MDDSVSVRVPYALRYLNDYLSCAIGLNRSVLLDLVAERDARNKLHHQVVGAVIFAERVKPGKVGVIQPRHRQSFLKEALFHDGAASVFAVKLLDCYDPSGRVAVFSFEDGSKSSASDIFNDPVVADLSGSHIRSPRA